MSSVSFSSSSRMRGENILRKRKGKYMWGRGAMVIFLGCGAEKLPELKAAPFCVVSERLKSPVEQSVNFNTNPAVSSGSDV